MWAIARFYASVDAIAIEHRCSCRRYYDIDVVPDAPRSDFKGSRSRIAHVLADPGCILLRRSLPNSDEVSSAILRLSHRGGRHRFDGAQGHPRRLAARDRSSATTERGALPLLVEAHGGRVAATSEFGAGSTFTVSIPWRRACSGDWSYSPGRIGPRLRKQK